MADRTPMALFMEGVRAIGADEHHDERLSYARGVKGEIYSPPGLDEYIPLLNMSGTPLIKIAIQTLAQTRTSQTSSGATAGRRARPLST